MISYPSQPGPEWARWLDSMEGVPAWTPPAAPRPVAGWQRTVGRTFERAGEFDVVNDHSGLPAAALGGGVSTPVVHTVHGPLDSEGGIVYAQVARVAPEVRGRGRKRGDGDRPGRGGSSPGPEPRIAAAG